MHGPSDSPSQESLFLVNPAWRTLPWAGRGVGGLLSVTFYQPWDQMLPSMLASHRADGLSATNRSTIPFSVSKTPNF